MALEERRAFGSQCFHCSHITTGYSCPCSLTQFLTDPNVSTSTQGSPKSAAMPQSPLDGWTQFFAPKPGLTVFLTVSSAFQFAGVIHWISLVILSVFFSEVGKDSGPEISSLG